ncbi:MAG TPA: dienelactone hydrolase family protein [Phycisphaerae bacterium]|nr:dienelactone hydrolase family protein [Phycisphaerae bacterium]
MTTNICFNGNIFLALAVTASIGIAAPLVACEPGSVRSATFAGAPPTSTLRRSTSGLPKEFVEAQLTLADKSEWKYLVYLPPQYEDNADHKWPVILCLHGSGEIGTENRAQTGVGLPRHILRNIDEFPFIVVMPQARSMWFRGANGAAAFSALEATLREYRTDRDRVYLTGFSMGGYGTWELSIVQPDVFAAIVPLCGDAPDDFLANIKSLPVWAFHGEMDKNVPVAGSRDAVRTLKELGADPKYTEYPKTGHKIWDKVYSSKALWRWLLEQRRPPPPRVIDYRMMTPLARVWWMSARAERGAKIARLHGERRDDGTVELQTEGVHSWALVSDREPLKPGDEITVLLNGVEIFKGKFSGALTFNVTTRPAAQTAP